MRSRVVFHIKGAQEHVTLKLIKHSQLDTKCHTHLGVCSDVSLLISSVLRLWQTASSPEEQTGLV